MTCCPNYLMSAMSVIEHFLIKITCTCNNLRHKAKWLHYTTDKLHSC